MERPEYILPQEKDVIRIIPFGGCGEFGMNLTAYIIDQKVYIVDCGVMFPDTSKLGVDAILPSVDPWFEELGGVYAYIITHGHEDHIGGLPFIIKNWPAPIYATPWTASLIERKFQRHKVELKFPLHVVQAGDHVVDGNVDIEYIHVNHSIPDACALYIKTKSHKIFHTGDFKFDDDPMGESPADLKRIAEVGKEGVDLLLADSTNAQRTGICGGEKTVMDSFRDIFDKTTDGAVVVTTFASNLWRLQCVAKICLEKDRKMVVLGSGISKTMEIASELEMLDIPSDLIIDETMVRNYARNKLCFMATGSQGESRASVAKISFREHKHFTIRPGDAIIFSSRTIPGNERVVQTMMSLLEQQGADIYSSRTHPNIHVSGHAYRGELAKLLELTKPKNFVPIHGTFSHLKSNMKIPEELSMHCDEVVLVDNGTILDLAKGGKVTVAGEIPVEIDFIDADAGSIMAPPILRERLKIGELGLAVVSGVFSTGKREWESDIQVAIRGLVLTDNQLKFIERAREQIRESISKLFADKVNDHAILEEEMRLTMRRALTQLVGKKPVVIAQLFLVG